MIFAAIILTLVSAIISLSASVAMATDRRLRVIFACISGTYFVSLLGISLTAFYPGAYFQLFSLAILAWSAMHLLMTYSIVRLVLELMNEKES